MIKLLKHMRPREKWMALLCLGFVVVQIYFDLRLPDYMTELTVLINTSGTTADIANVGFKMLGCTAASAAMAIACGHGKDHLDLRNVVCGSGDQAGDRKVLHFFAAQIQDHDHILFHNQLSSRSQFVKLSK